MQNYKKESDLPSAVAEFFQPTGVKLLLCLHLIVYQVINNLLFWMSMLL